MGFAPLNLSYILTVIPAWPDGTYSKAFRYARFAMDPGKSGGIRPRVGAAWPAAASGGGPGDRQGMARAANRRRGGAGRAQPAVARGRYRQKARRGGRRAARRDRAKQ